MAQGSTGAGIVDSSQQSLLPTKEDSVTGTQRGNKMVLKLDVKGGRRTQQQNMQDDEATASDSCNRMDEEPSGTSLLQSRNASNDHLAEFATGSRIGVARKTSQRAGSISIKLLLEEGIISPGKGVLQMEYKGISHSADLTEDGKIEVDIDGTLLVFDSPSAFSIHLKRLVNPTRKADDGWKSVKYNGNFLEHYKVELARKMFGLDTSGGGEDGLLSRRNKRQKPLLNDVEPPPSPPRSPRIRTPIYSAVGADVKECVVPLQEYAGDQPIILRVAPKVEAVIDFHAHLCYNEVTGVLLGTSLANHVNVMMALPMETVVEDGTPVAKLAMNSSGLEKQILKAKNKLGDVQIVGYYHSHPDFAPQPTIIDTVYAARETLAMRESGGPCIQCIISPYNKDAQAEDIAPVSWYHVSVPDTVDTIPDNTLPESLGCVPYRLAYSTFLGENEDLCDVASLQKTIEHLAKMYAPSRDRVNIEGLWRKTEEGQVVLRLRKLIRSFEAKLSRGPYFGKLRSFASFKLEVLVRAVWSVYGRRPTAENEETSRGPKSVMMSNQNSESLAGVSSMQENGTTEPPASEDEPISEDDEQTE